MAKSSKKGCGCLAIIIATVGIAAIGVWNEDNKQQDSQAEPRKNKVVQATAETPSSQAALPNSPVHDEPHEADSTTETDATPDWPSRAKELREKAMLEFVPPRIGQRITIRLDGRKSRTGTLKDLTESSVTLATDNAEMVYERERLPIASRVRLFEADYATHKAIAQVKAERNQYQQEQIAEAVQLAEDFIENQFKSNFSRYDGRHIMLEILVKEQIHDPRSFKHVKTKVAKLESGYEITMHYRGKNAFGATVMNWIKATCDDGGNLTGIVSDGI
jgi:cytoskeletal protein RodZ